MKGYSLIELMVVVAIIGIITTIAYPSYQSYTCDTYKGQAVADLKVCALALERYYSDGFTYVGADADPDAICSPLSPDENNPRFDITFTVSANNYTVQAEPVTGETCGAGTTIQLVADGTLTETN